MYMLEFKHPLSDWLFNKARIYDSKMGPFYRIIDAKMLGVAIKNLNGTGDFVITDNNGETVYTSSCSVG